VKVEQLALFGPLCEQLVLSFEVHLSGGDVDPSAWQNRCMRRVDVGEQAVPERMPTASLSIVGTVVAVLGIVNLLFVPGPLDLVFACVLLVLSGVIAFLCVRRALRPHRRQVTLDIG
jgi:hypothetical protein